MEAHAGRVQAERDGEPEDVHGLADRAAVLAGQWPVGAVAGGDQAAEDGRTGRGLGDLPDLRRRVHDEDADTEGGRLRDMVAPLDGVRVDEVVRRRAGGQAGAHLGRAGDVEVAAGRHHRGEHLRVRVGLDRVVDRDTGQRRRELTQTVGDDRGLDLQEGCAGKGHHGGPRHRLGAGRGDGRGGGLGDRHGGLQGWCGGRGQGVALRRPAKEPGDTSASSPPVGQPGGRGSGALSGVTTAPIDRNR